MSELPTEPASLADGRYQVIGALGEGAQGETLEAIDKREGRLVAVKRFRIRGARSWKSVELAEREARVLARLQHPALPCYLDHFEEDGALYLVMGKVEGVNLARRLSEGLRFTQQDVVRLLREAAIVLDYLHTQSPPVIHRDLKPGNVVIRPDQSFAFVDFGCVRDSLKPEGGSTVVGTFGYMAPEQFQGRALPASDVYAIGATALTMLTGREPEQLPHKGLAIDVSGTLEGIAAPELVWVLERMLEPDPDRRAPRLAPLLASLPDSPQTPAEGRRTAAPEQPPPEVPPPGSRRRSRRRTRRRRHEAREVPPSLQDLGHNLREELRRAWQEIQDELLGSDATQRWSTSGAPTFHPGATARHRNVGSFGIACATASLDIARLATWAVFALIIPVILSLIAAVSGRSSKSAAARTNRVGALIDDRLRRARERLQSRRPSTARSPRVRVDKAPPRVRVDEEEHESAEDQTSHGGASAHHRSVQHRGL